MRLYIIFFSLFLNFNIWAILLPPSIYFPSDQDSGDAYGGSIARGTDFLAVGAPLESSIGTDPTDNSAAAAGAVFILKEVDGSWTQQDILKAATPVSGERFGIAVAASENTVVVGASSAHAGTSEPNAGAVYVFVRNGSTWIQQARLTGSDTEENDAFGTAVAISADTLIVGAMNADSDGIEDSGKVYVFSRTGSTWTQQTILKASNPGVGDAFGASVALSLHTLIVGAPFEDGNGTAETDNSMVASGAAYIFVREDSGWVQQSYLKSAAASAADAYASAVTLAADTALISAPHHSEGRVHVCQRTGASWLQQATLQASNAGAGDAFGTSVSMIGDTALIGAPREDSSSSGIHSAASLDDSAQDSGAAYEFRRSAGTWTQTAYIKATNAVQGDYFGAAVSTFANTHIVGAARHSSNAGAVYLIQDSQPRTIIEKWRQTYFSTEQNLGISANLADHDHDGVSNLAEFAFGTDPLAAQSATSSSAATPTQVQRKSVPTIVPSHTGQGYNVVITRRQDWQAAGLTYTYEFSTDLETWTVNSATPTILATDGYYESVSVPFPNIANSDPGRFVRVQVSIAP
jgi:hypothetical protein